MTIRSKINIIIDLMNIISIQVVCKTFSCLCQSFDKRHIDIVKLKCRVVQKALSGTERDVDCARKGFALRFFGASNANPRVFFTLVFCWNSTNNLVGVFLL